MARLLYALSVVLFALAVSRAWANDVDIEYDPPSNWSVEADPPDVSVRAFVCTGGCTAADLYRNGEFVFEVGWDDGLVPEYSTYCYSFDPSPPWDKWGDDDDAADDDDDADDPPSNMAEYCAAHPQECKDCDENGVRECWGNCGKRGWIELIDSCVSVEEGSEETLEYRAEADTGQGIWEDTWEVTVPWVDPCQTPGVDDDANDNAGGSTGASCAGCPSSFAPVGRAAPLGLVMLGLGVGGLALGRRRDRTSRGGLDVG